MSVVRVSTFLRTAELKHRKLGHNNQGLLCLIIKDYNHDHELLASINFIIVAINDRSI